MDIGGGDHGKDIGRDLVAHEGIHGGQNLSVAAASRLRPSKFVMERLRPVYADAHQKPFSRKELRPDVINEQPIGLQGVNHSCAGRENLPLEAADGLKEVQSGHGGLAALPVHAVAGHFGGGVAPHHGLQNRKVHPPGRLGEDGASGKVEAIAAAQVAVPRDRLDKQGETGLHLNCDTGTSRLRAMSLSTNSS